MSGENEEQPSNTDGKIIRQDIENEMKKSYIDYAMSVIVGRALPDVRDGLKPVHRRILYSMSELSMRYNTAYKKCARIVGEAMGKYHPHGDQAVYDSLVRMAQSFSLRYPLIDGQGNFGSIDGDNAAAMRYTEARMAKITDEMLFDLDKDTVEFSPNFDESLKEPTVLPTRLPSLLINGSSGIAVGMATNMPPHNLAEIGNALITLIDNEEIDVKELLQIVKGPDFPTGGIITGTSGIFHAYSQGRGRVKVRAKIEKEEGPKRRKLIIKEIPYMVNKSSLVEQIANCVRDKKIEGISDLRDESDRKGMRIVVVLKNDANEEVVINQLYKYTRCQDTFGIINLALVDGQPKVLPLKDILSNFLKHRKTVIRRRTQYDLKKAKAREHILLGLVKALDNIDEIVELIKKAPTVANAQEQLMSKFDLSELQSKAILEMRLSRLAALEQDKIRKELDEIRTLIKQLQFILDNASEILKIIKEETQAIVDKYSDTRRTEIVEGLDDDIDIEDLIEKEDMVVTMSLAGYVKRISIDAYKAQRRGGKGIKAAATKEDDILEHLFIANTHDYLLIITNKGKLHWLKVYKIPQSGRYSKGTAIINLVRVEKDEKVSAVIPVKEFDEKHFLFMATAKGTVKKTNLHAFSRPRQAGIRAILLDEGDEVVDVKLTNSEKQVMLATKKGMAIKFHEQDVRPMGRSSRGVRGIRLDMDDKVIGMTLATDQGILATITENGFGKRTRMADYRLINRGGKGVRNILCTPRNGKVVAIKSVENDDLMFISAKGIVIRTPAQDISIIGRNTQGVRLMRIGTDDKVVSAAKIVNDEEDEVVESAD